MNTADLASAIIDVQETFDADEMIAISAMPDNRIVTQFFSEPQSGVSILRDYTQSQLDNLFLDCNDLRSATAKVARLYSAKPLNTAESNHARDTVLRATLDAVSDIAQSRRINDDKHCAESILVLVVSDLQQFINHFQP